MFALTGKETEVAFGATVTRPGAHATAGLLLDITITAPRDPARKLMATIPLAAVPLEKVRGLTLKPESAGFSTASTQSLTTVPRVAEIVHDASAVRAGSVVMVKLTDGAPSGTVTTAGTVANSLSLDSATVVPPARPSPFNDTVP